MAKGRAGVHPGPRGTNDRPTAQAEILQVPVEFGSYSDGEQYVRLPFTVSRTKFKPKDAERHLCGARLSVRCVRDPNAAGDTPNQKPLVDPDPSDVVQAQVDVKGYRATRKQFGAALVFNRESIDPKHLLDFSRQVGWIEMERVGDAEDGRKKRSDYVDAADDDDDQATLGLDGE